MLISGAKSFLKGASSCFRDAKSYFRDVKSYLRSVRSVKSRSGALNTRCLRGAKSYLRFAPVQETLSFASEALSDGIVHAAQRAYATIYTG